MKNEAIRMKCRKAEEHAAFWCVAANPQSLIVLKKVIKVISLMYIFVHRAKKLKVSLLILTK